MAKVSAGDIRNGVTIEVDGKVCQVIDFMHVKPGKGAAFVRVKMKNIIDGGVVETTFRPTETFEQAHIERKKMQYLYNDGEFYNYMDNETFEQIMISAEDAADSMKFVKENEEVTISTKIGTYTYAIGSDEFVAKNMGINVNKYKVLAFILSGAFLGVMAILTISYGSSMVAVTGMASMSRNFVPTMGCFFGLAFKKYGMPLQAIIIGEFVINIIFFGFIALGAPTAIQDVITGFALLIIVTLTTKVTKGEIVK